MFQGTPKVSLNPTGTITSDPTFQQNLNDEVAKLTDDIKDFRYYPIVSLGLAYKF